MFPATKTVEMLRNDPLQQQEDIGNKNVNKNNINKSKNDINHNKNNHNNKNSISINQNDNNINNNNINNIMQQQSVKTTTITEASRITSWTSTTPTCGGL